MKSVLPMADLAAFLAAKYAMGFHSREDQPDLKLAKIFFILPPLLPRSFLSVAFLREAH